MDALAELEALIGGMSPAEIADLDKLIAAELREPWLPTPGPQAEAYYSQADLLLYGGAAGGGKTDLGLGLALTQHTRTVFFRRAYVDLRGAEERLIEINKSRDGYNGHDMVYRKAGRLIEFGALERPGSEMSWQGRPHDLIVFDEGAQLSAAKVAFVLGWLRSAEAGQRKRAIIATNPPMGGDGDWLIEWFAPWVDPLFPNPASPGEIRYAIVRGAETIWVDGPEPIVIDEQTYTPLSRTFLPSRLEDNPYLRDTGYRAQLESLPEPLRSQLLHGDFLAGREDHEWQVIPSEWIRLAQKRWQAAPPKRRKMIALSADVALGGLDNCVLAPLHEDAWFGPLVRRKGAEIKDPSDIATLMVQTQKDGADLSVDGTGGWGSGVRSDLQRNHGIECASLIYSATSAKKSRDGKFGFHNLRAEMYWGLREALDPEDGDNIMLPPGTGTAAELTTPRYKVRGTNILIEGKDDIKKRIGRSTDDGDAIVQAWHRRLAAPKKGAPVAESSYRVSGDEAGQAWLLS